MARIASTKRTWFSLIFRFSSISFLESTSRRLDVLSKKLIELNLKINENQVRFVEANRAIKLLQPLPAES